jgi:rhamnulokinase
MVTSYNYVAIDLGAESGRTMVASLKDGKLSLNEVHRFQNRPVRLNDGLHWDVLQLWEGIKNGIACANKSFTKLESLGLDSWGVDFALLDGNGSLLSNPFHYRDTRTDGMLEEAFRRMPPADIFASTGIQFMQINTLYQLLAMSIQKSPLFDVAKKFVTIPDLFNYWLSGEIINEFSNATTTQCFDPKKRDWARPVIQKMDIPLEIFGKVSESGTKIGGMLPSVAEETGSDNIQVILPACHDTGSAVVAVPANTQDFVWISSGTWSIMGVEVDQPVLTDQALARNFTNEGGVFGTWRFSKNVAGLWLIQECKRTWEYQGDNLSYDSLTHLAAAARPFVAVIDPDDPKFLHPGDMPSRITKYCLETHQEAPQTKGEMIRLLLESIALKYRWVLDGLEQVAGKSFAPIHIIGGGSKNWLLNQFTADATNRPVITGPVEATAVGNAMMQAISLGHFSSLSEARIAVRDSFEVNEYYPARRDGWDEAYQKLLRSL